MVLPDGKLIGGFKAQEKLKLPDCHKVFIFAVAKRNELALKGIFILQIFNLSLLWLYLLSTAVSFFVNYLSDNGRPEQLKSGGPFGHWVRQGTTYLKRAPAA